jgi:predicted RNase H-like HicB family nuclease
MGLVIVAVSYEGVLTVNFTLCPDVVEDGETLTDLLKESLEVIEAAAAELPASSNEPEFHEQQNQSLADDALSAMESLLRNIPGRFRR